MKPLIFPIVNLNGNSRESLVEQLFNVMSALRAAEDAFRRNCDVQHGRNFQTEPDNTKWFAARNAWSERVMALKDMRDEINALALAISRNDPSVLEPGTDRGVDLTVHK